MEQTRETQLAQLYDVLGLRLSTGYRPLRRHKGELKHSCNIPYT